MNSVSTTCHFVTNSGVFTTMYTVKFRKFKPWGLYFSKALLEGLIFRGAYLRKEICVSKSIGLASYLEVNLPFSLCFTSYLRAVFQVQARGGLIFGGAI